MATLDDQYLLCRPVFWNLLRLLVCPYLRDLSFVRVSWNRLRLRVRPYLWACRNRGLPVVRRIHV